MKNYKITVVTTSNGVLKQSKPCMHCLESIKLIGIQRITYSIHDGYITEKACDMKTDHMSYGQKQYRALGII